jgi:hypothetical protein
MIAPDADTIRQDLCGHMAVAEMPGDARKMMGIARSDFRDRLVRSYDANDAPVFQFQTIAVVQHRRFGKVEKKNGVFLAAHGDATAVTSVMRQFD